MLAGVVQLGHALSEFQLIAELEIFRTCAQSFSGLVDSFFAVANGLQRSVDFFLRFFGIPRGLAEGEAGSDVVEAFYLEGRGLLFFLKDVDVGRSPCGNQFFVGPDLDLVRR